MTKIKFLLNTLLVILGIAAGSNSFAARPLDRAPVNSAVGVITGIINCDGQPIEDARVYIPGESFVGFTNTSGVINLREVPEGTYDVKIVPANTYGPKVIAAVQVLRGQIATLSDTDFCAPVDNEIFSGNYQIDPPISASCVISILGTDPIVLNISNFDFNVQASGTMSVSGADLVMNGSITDGIFNVIGEQRYDLPLIGSYRIIYELNGSFVTNDSWNGVFRLRFIGLESISNCADQSFTISGNRI